MTCPHAETTTIAWLYGEAHDHHAEHVAVCVACAAVAALHGETLGAMVLAPAPVAATPLRRWRLAPAVLALAFLLAALFFPTPPPRPEGDAAGPSSARRVLQAAPDPLDVGLDRVAADLVDLHLDLDVL